jgi:outer membrane lipoprotein-sorting protein
LVCLLLLSSCAKRVVDIDLSRINPPELLERVRKAEESVESVKGLASVSIRSPERRTSFSQVTIAKEPNFLRLEALAPFGRTAAVIISDGVRVHIITPKEREIFDSLHEFDFSFFYPDLPVRITVGSLVNLLLGRLPEERTPDESGVQMSKDSYHIILTFTDDEERRDTLWVNPLTYRVERAKIELQAGVVADCRFKNFKYIGAGTSFPTRMELKVNDFSISIRYNDQVEVNGEIDRDLFRPDSSLAGFEKAS